MEPASQASEGAHDAPSGTAVDPVLSRTFKIVVRRLRRQAYDPIPESVRGGDHLVRVVSAGEVLFETPRGAEASSGLEGAFDAIRSALDAPEGR